MKESPPASSPEAVPKLGSVLRFAWREALQPHLRMCLRWLLFGALALAPAVVGPQLLSSMMQVIQQRTENSEKVQKMDAEPKVGAVPNAGLEAKPGGGERKNQIWLVFALWAGLLVILGPLFSYMERRSSVLLDLAIGTRLKLKTYEAVLNKPLQFFHSNDRGGLMYLLRDVATECQMALRQLTLDFGLQAFHVVASASMLIWSFVNLAEPGKGSTQLPIAIAVLLLGLTAPLLVSRFGRRFQKVATNLRESNQAAASLIEGSLRSPEEMQAFDAARRYTGKYEAALGDINLQRQAQSSTMSLANMMGALPTDLVQVLLLGTGLAMALTSNAAVGPLVAVLQLAPQMMRAMQGLGSFGLTYNSSLPSISKMMELLEEPVVPILSQAQPGEPIGKAATLNGQAEVRAEGVDFGYTADHLILNKFNFVPRTGELTALVASMGAGKSTFFRLLLNFYPASSGCVLLDGKEVNQWDQRQLRARIGYMAQFPSFTHESVRENFRIAVPLATDAEIISLCAESGLSEVLEAKFGSAPDFLDQPFASGQLLSGGEKKLFALVRCLLRRPGLLLLDEPTTGVDNEHKEEFGRMIRKCCIGITAIIVDHDVEWLHTLCDQIAVLEDGSITFIGTPDGAAAQNPLYKRLLRCPEQKTSNGHGNPQDPFLLEAPPSNKQRPHQGDVEIIEVFGSTQVK